MCRVLLGLEEFTGLRTFYNIYLFLDHLIKFQVILDSFSCDLDTHTVTHLTRLLIVFYMANHHHHHLIHFIGASTDWRGGCLSVSPSVRLSWLLAASVDNTGLVHDLQFIVCLISRVGVSDQFIWNKIHQNQLYLTCSSKTEDCTDSQRTLLLINIFIAGEVVANQQQQLWRWSNWDLPRRLKWLMHTSLTRSTKALHCWPVTELIPLARLFQLLCWQFI